MDYPVSALLAALQGGADAGAGPVRAPVANRYLTNTRDSYDAQAQDAENFARMAAQQRAAQPMAPAAAPQTGITGGYNRLVDALNPQPR